MNSHHASPEVIRRGCLEQCVRGDEEEDHAEADTDDEPASDGHAAAVGECEGAEAPAECGAEEEVTFALDAARVGREEEGCGEGANSAHRH